MTSYKSENVDSKYGPVGSPPVYVQPRQEPDCLEVNTCCCGCTLEQGCKIIGWLQMIGGIIGGASGILVLASSQARDSAALLVMGVITTVANVIAILMGFLLLYGVAKKRSTALFSWIVITLVLMVLTVLSTIIELAAGNISGIASPIISLCLAAYYVVVVRSYHKQVKDQQPVV